MNKQKIIEKGKKLYTVKNTSAHQAIVNAWGVHNFLIDKTNFEYVLKFPITVEAGESFDIYKYKKEYYGIKREPITSNHRKNFRDEAINFGKFLAKKPHFMNDIDLAYEVFVGHILEENKNL